MQFVAMLFFIIFAASLALTFYSKDDKILKILFYVLVISYILYLLALTFFHPIVGFAYIAIDGLLILFIMRNPDFGNNWYVAAMYALALSFSTITLFSILEVFVGRLF